MEDGTLDQICVRCRKFQMRAFLKPIGAELSAPLSASLTEPIMRETIEVPFLNGSEHTRMTVYKDELSRQINERLFKREYLGTFVSGSND